MRRIASLIASALGGEELSISLFLDEADVDEAAELLKYPLFLLEQTTAQTKTMTVFVYKSRVIKPESSNAVPIIAKTKTAIWLIGTETKILLLC